MASHISSRKIYISEARLQALRVRRQRLDQLRLPLRYLVATAATLATDSSVSLKWTSESWSFLAPLKGGQPFHRALVSKIRAVGLREMAEGPCVHDIGHAVVAMTRRVHRKVANGPFLRDISHAGAASDGVGLALVVQGGGWRSYRSGSRSRQGPSHLTHRGARIDFDPGFRWPPATRRWR